MSFLKEGIKVKGGGPYQWWRISTFTLLAVMFGSLVMSSIVIYNYTFRTLEDAHTIVILNTDTVVNNVNMDNYRKAVALVGLKSASTTIAMKRNIFQFVGAVVEAPSTSTTTFYATTTPQ